MQPDLYNLLTRTASDFNTIQCEQFVYYDLKQITNTLVVGTIKTRIKASNKFSDRK